MLDPYPFKGVWRWAVLPSLLALAGLLGGWAGGLADGAMGTAIRMWLVWGFVKAAVEGGAMAVGRRPFVALGAAMVLGGLSLWLEKSLISAAFGSLGTGGPPDARIEAISGYGAVSALMVLVHHLYLRLRRRGWWTALAAGLLYPAAAVAGMRVFEWIYPSGGFRTNLVLWGVAEGLLAWIALVVAVRLAERKEVA